MIHLDNKMTQKLTLTPLKDTIEYGVNKGQILFLNIPALVICAVHIT